MTDSRTMGLIDALEQGAKLTREEWRHVLTKRNKEIADVVFQKHRCTGPCLWKEDLHSGSD